MTVIHAEDPGRMGIDAIIEKARAVVGEGPTYLSFDIDSMDPAFAPGTGTPEPMASPAGRPSTFFTN